MAFASLPRARVLKAARLLRAAGRKLPRVGQCTIVRAAGSPLLTSQTRAIELCRDQRGYFAFPLDAGGLFGARLRRKRIR